MMDGLIWTRALTECQGLGHWLDERTGADEAQSIQGVLQISGHSDRNLASRHLGKHVGTDTKVSAQPAKLIFRSPRVSG